MVLVINDNLNRLMFALSVTFRICPYTMLKSFVGFKVAIRRNCVQIQDEPFRRDHELKTCHPYGDRR
jgi:hypothetical protein